jgi:cytochrome c
VKRIFIFLALLASATPIARAQTHAPFTQAQADNGALVYTQHCMYCHGQLLAGHNGVPPLIGSSFRKQFASAKAIFDFVKVAMPASDPGVLTKQQYLNVTAYILSKNGQAPGKSPLTLSALGETKHR